MSNDYNSSLIQTITYKELIHSNNDMPHELFNIINNFSVTLEAKDNAPIHESESYQDYLESRKAHDYKLMNSFVASVQRGIGINMPFYFKYICMILIKNAPDNLFQKLNELEDLFEIRLICSDLPVDTYIEILSKIHL